MAVEIYALRYGSSPFSRRLLFSDETTDAVQTIAWALYLARAGGRTVVIDTGFTDRTVAAAWSITMHHEPLELLAGLGVRPEQVDDVIITHHHNDHIAQAARYTRARIHIATAARDAYRSQGPEGTDPELLHLLADPLRTVAFTGEQVVANGLLRIEEIGGHSPGSSVVHLPGFDDRHVITGDECYVCANLEEGRTIGVTCDHARNADFLARARSVNAIPLPFHDELIFERYPVVGPGIVRIIPKDGPG